MSRRELVGLVACLVAAFVAGCSTWPTALPSTASANCRLSGSRHRPRLRPERSRRDRRPLRDPAVDVRAITIAGTGIVHCQAGRLMTRYLLDEFGTADIPGRGREAGGVDAHPSPTSGERRPTRPSGSTSRRRPNSGRAARRRRRHPGGGRREPQRADDRVAGATDEPRGWVRGRDETLPDRLAGVHAMLGTVSMPWGTCSSTAST